jgi:hypothetical protein
MTATARKTESLDAVDVVIDSDLWSAHPDAEAIVQRAIAAASSATQTGGGAAVLLTDERAMARKGQADQRPVLPRR